MEDCVDKILAICNNGENSQYKTIIKLMNNLKNGSNVFEVRNCLIILINLCFDVEYSDYVDNVGKSVSDLSDTERSRVCELLMAEISN
ncbi:MAG: hypothetical protein KGD61_02580 [Candidatus Lokiarchaeota archaeon]|nr:hypothetical protein [Candidatus Lokiarchaeota archaeon]